ncbi:amidohydrolase family protein [Spirosoma koreense]
MKVLLTGGCVITMDEQQTIYERADVLLTGDRITAIQPSIDADDCERIDASNQIIMPGFIDTHRHLWESVVRGTAGDYFLMEYLQHVLGPLAASFRAQDVYTANLLGALEALDAGVTTLFDWSHIMNTPDHADSAIAGLKEAGIRAVFGYGTPGTSVWEWFYESQRTHPTDIERLCQQHFSSADQLVTPAMAIRGPEYSAFDVAAQDIHLARRLNLPISMHVGCGTFADKYQAVSKLASAGLLGPDLNFAHGNFLSIDDFKLLADHGCSLSITPEVEMQMGLGFPATGKALAAGLKPSLGVDVVSGVSGDLFTQMRIALQTERALANDTHLRAGQMPQTIALTMADALRWGTINGAKALHLDRKTGSLVAGKQADLLLVNTDALNLSPMSNPIAAVVSQASVANIDSVFVAGQAVKRHGRLLYPNLASLKQQAKKTAGYLLEKALMTSLAQV